ncbi:MAG TPA: phosphoribosyltransferase [Steroidobacteraceae bacterium]|nr:phosphoribosyltransferase [Steroidobacteraceae bacterium]
MQICGQAVYFDDRADAGRSLARALGAYAGRTNMLVLALPRGGVPVAYEVARALQAELDVFLVRKLGVPGHEELAMGAIASGGVRVVNERVVLAMRIAGATIDSVTAAERDTLDRRERSYRGDNPRPDVRERIVILVDDGLATGSSMRAALEALGRQDPRRLIAAVPVAPPATCEALRAEADEVVCVSMPAAFRGVSEWYRDFAQTTDDEVRTLLTRSAQDRLHGQHRESWGP